MEVATRSGARHAQGCLFCRKHDGGFTSVEHIISRGLLNDDQEILPAGVVCDRCNHGPLARADRALTDFEPIQLLRAERGLGTRSGRAVVSHWKEGSIAYTAPGELAIFGQGPSPVVHTKPGTFQMPLTPPGPFKAKRGLLLLRAVWKVVIEYIYLDQAVDAAFDRRLDPARREVLGEGDGRGWLALPKDCIPNGGCSNDLPSAGRDRGLACPSSLTQRVRRPALYRPASARPLCR